jgi:hypothetical protein
MHLRRYILGPIPNSTAPSVGPEVPASPVRPNQPGALVTKQTSHRSQSIRTNKRLVQKWEGHSPLPWTRIFDCYRCISCLAEQAKQLVQELDELD